MFLQLAAVLVPLFVGASFLVGLVEENGPLERVGAMLGRRNRERGNVAAASAVSLVFDRGGAPLGRACSFLVATPIVNEVTAFLS